MLNRQKLDLLCGHIAGHVLGVEPGSRIQIVSIDNDGQYATALARAVLARGGVPLVENEDSNIMRGILLEASDSAIEALGAEHYRRLEGMDASVVIKGYRNIYTLGDIPMDSMAKYHVACNNLFRHHKAGHKVHRLMLRAPTDHMAQSAGVTLDVLCDRLLDAACINFDKFYERSRPLEDMMKRRPRVRMVSQGTDISLTIDSAGIGSGRGNIPDGEIVGTPDPDSVTGVVSFNIPQIYMGFIFRDIRLEVEHGRIVRATANDTERLNRVLNTDEGARRFGEWSIGLNPYLRSPVTDILLDEKMTGSIHITPGMSPLNTSEVHWDIIQSHLPEYGGGEIYFDGQLIRRDGLFTHPDLLNLNPEPYSRYIEECCRL